MATPAAGSKTLINTKGIFGSEWQIRSELSPLAFCVVFAKITRCSSLDDRKRRANGSPISFSPSSQFCLCGGCCELTFCSQARTIAGCACLCSLISYLRYALRRSSVFINSSRSDSCASFFVGL